MIAVSTQLLVGRTDLVQYEWEREKLMGGDEVARNNA